MSNPFIPRIGRPAPCKDCKERWVNEEGRCHDTCERYAQWRGEVQAANDKRSEYISTEGDANDYELNVRRRLRRGK